MAGICVNHIRNNGVNCDHRTVTVNFDGESLVLDVSEAELDATPWTAAEKKQFIKLGLKRLRVLGLALDNVIGRVTNGEEATNVKSWMILGKDVTKTNIGTTYVNVSPGLNGERMLIDLTGCTQYRLILNLNCVGSGAWGARLVRDSDNAIIVENGNITGAGEKELDTGWQNIPGTVQNTEFLVRLQGKSTTAADDPVFRRAIMFSR